MLQAQFGIVLCHRPMGLCFLWGRSFEDIFENTQWRKVEQMQPTVLQKQLDLLSSSSDSVCMREWRKKSTKSLFCIFYSESRIRTFLAGVLNLVENLSLCILRDPPLTKQSLQWVNPVARFLWCSCVFFLYRRIWRHQRLHQLVIVLYLEESPPLVDVLQWENFAAFIEFCGTLALWQHQKLIV